MLTHVIPAHGFGGTGNVVLFALIYKHHMIGATFVKISNVNTHWRIGLRTYYTAVLWIRDSKKGT